MIRNQGLTPYVPTPLQSRTEANRLYVFSPLPRKERLQLWGLGSDCEETAKRCISMALRTALGSSSAIADDDQRPCRGPRLGPDEARMEPSAVVSVMARSPSKQEGAADRGRRSSVPGGCQGMETSPETIRGGVRGQAHRRAARSPSCRRRDRSGNPPTIPLIFAFQRNFCHGRSAREHQLGDILHALA
jgi:hypothetical protein